MHKLNFKLFSARFLLVLKVSILLSISLFIIKADRVFAATTVYTQISSALDDVNEDGSNYSEFNGSIWLGNASSTGASFTGLRFNGVNVPQGATITSAYVDVYSPQNSWIGISYEIAAEASGNSFAFSSSSKPSQRPLTIQKIPHSSNAQWLANTWYASDDVKNVVQEVISRPDWVSGNSLSIILRGTGGAWGRKFATSYDGSAVNSPKLVITYDSAVVTTNTPTPTQIISNTPTPTQIISNTPTPTPTTVLSGNTALKFDGADDQVEGPIYASSSGTQTMEAWVRPSTNNAYGIVMHTRDEDDTKGYIIELRNGRAELWVYGTDGVDRNLIDTNTTMLGGQWYHVAATYDAATHLGQIFVNGVSGGVKDMGTMVPGFATRFGAFGGGGFSVYSAFDGVVDEARISNTIRYTSNFTPQSSPFQEDANTIALYHFDDASGQSVSDSSIVQQPLTLGLTSSSESTDPLWVTSTAPLSSNPSLNIVHFPVGSGTTEVTPHQIIRTSDDRVYIFSINNDSSQRINAYWTQSPGLPVSGGFTGATQITDLDQNGLIQLDAVFDGNSTVHVVVNTQAGNIKDYPFDITTNTFKTPIVIDTGAPSVLGLGGVSGSGGVVGMIDTLGRLHIVYRSFGDHITHRIYSYDNTQNTLNMISSPFQLDSNGLSNHPVVAVSPLDNSVTVAWVDESSVSARIMSRTRTELGVWSSEQQVNSSPIWVSRNAGVNIDQGPSIVISSLGTKFLAYMEDWKVSGSQYQYGNVHIATSTGLGWVDQVTPVWTHDPAIGITNSGQIYIVGHGFPLNQGLGCLNMDDMCYTVKNSDGSWGIPQLLAARSSGQSFDTSPSIKWSAVGWNRANVLEFVFSATPYSAPTLYYGRVDSQSGAPTPTPTSTPSSTPTPTTISTPIPTVTPTPTSIPTPTVTSTPTPTQIPSGNVAVQVKSASDDVNEDGNKIYLNDSSVWLGNGGSATGSYTGLRFTNVNIPQGSTVTSAHFELYSTQNSWIGISYDVFADDVANSAAFSNSNKPSKRVLTTQKVSHSSNVQWLASSWYSSNDISNIVQEVVDRPDWVNGNSISIILRGTGNSWGRKFVRSFNGSSVQAPKLVVTYQ